MTGPIPVVILAGGKPVTGPDGEPINRGLIRVEGRTMLERVVSALLGAPSVGEIVVVGNTPSVEGSRSIPDTGGFVDNILAGIAQFAGAAHVLVATSDTPFLTPECVEDFVTRALALEADFVYPFVPVKLCYERFPGVKRTSIRIREGALTGGNMVMARPGFLVEQRGRTEEAYAARKSPFKLATMIGLGMTLRLVVGMTVFPAVVGVAELERAISNLLGGKARGVCSSYPEIATDIDRPEELAAFQSQA